MSLLAYIDPGSGSLLLQALLAALLSIPFFFRRTIGDFGHKVRGDSKAEAVQETDGTEPTER
jgi:hypothetical protein